MKLIHLTQNSGDPECVPYRWMLFHIPTQTYATLEPWGGTIEEALYYGDYVDPTAPHNKMDEQMIAQIFDSFDIGGEFVENYELHGCFPHDDY